PLEGQIEVPFSQVIPRARETGALSEDFPSGTSEVSGLRTMATRWGLALAVASIMLAFAGNSVITRYLIVGGLASPVLLTIVRFVSGFGMLLLLRATFPRSFSGPFRGRSDLIGGFLLGLYALSISFGYAFISAAAGTLVFYAFVILTMALFGVVHDRETPKARSIVGQILALAGVAVMAFRGRSQGVHIQHVPRPRGLMLAPDSRRRDRRTGRRVHPDQRERLGTRPLHGHDQHLAQLRPVAPHVAADQGLPGRDCATRRPGAGFPDGNWSARGAPDRHTGPRRRKRPGRNLSESSESRTALTTRRARCSGCGGGRSADRTSP